MVVTLENIQNHYHKVRMFGYVQGWKELEYEEMQENTHISQACWCQ